MEVYQQLKHLGCYAAQGTLLSKAIPADSVIGVIKAIESAAF